MSFPNYQTMTREHALSAIKRKLNYNAGSISLPVAGIAIGSGHTAFPGDKVWSDAFPSEFGAMTLIGWADGPAVPLKWRAVLCEEMDNLMWPKTLHPSRQLAAVSARKRISRLYRNCRKRMKLYRQGIAEMDKIIATGRD